MELAARTGAWTPSGAPLPYDAEVEWLESDGNQYVITPITMKNEDFVLKIGVTLTSNNNFYQGGFFGARTKSNFCVRTEPSQGRHPLIVDFGLENTTPYDVTVGVAFDVEVRRIDGSINTYVNGELQSSFSATYLNDDYCWLFGINRNPPVKAFCRIANCSYESETLSYDVLAVRKDGVGYMYDRVSGQFFGNAGTGAFVIGPDVVSSRGGVNHKF